MAHPPEDRGYSSGLSDLLAQSVEQQVAEQRALQTALAQVAAVLPRLGDLDPARLHAAIRESVQQAVQDSVRQVVSATVAVEVRAALAPLAQELKQELAQLHENDRSTEQLAEITESTANASADAEETLEKVDALTQQVEGLKTEFLEGLMGIRATAEGVRVDIAEATEGTRSSMQDLLQRGSVGGAPTADVGAVWDDIRDGLAGVRTDLDQMPPAVAAAVGGRLAESLEGLRVAIAAGSNGSAGSSEAAPALVSEVAALRRDVATLRLLLVEQPAGAPAGADGGSLSAVEARLRRYVDDAVVQLAAVLLGVEAPAALPLPEPEIPAEPAYEAPIFQAPPALEPPAAPALAEPDLEPLELEEAPWMTADPADLGESAPIDDVLEPEPLPESAAPPVASGGSFVNEFMPYLNDESPYLNDEFEWQPLPPTGPPPEVPPTAAVKEPPARPVTEAPTGGVDVGHAPRRSGGHDITGPIELDRLRGESPPPDPATIRDLPPPEDLELAGVEGESGDDDDGEGGKRRWWKRHATSEDPPGAPEGE